MLRLFTGFDLPASVEASLEAFLRKLRPLARGAGWSPLANLHVTTKFIGAWPEERLQELEDALAAFAKPPAAGFELAIRGVGWFPNPHQPRVLFAGVQAPGALHELASATSRACAALGVPEEEGREYSPHLTLARLKNVSRQEIAELRREIATAPSLDFGSFPARSFFLYKSETRAGGGGGSHYTKLAEFPLG